MRNFFFPETISWNVTEAERNQVFDALFNPTNVMSNVVSIVKNSGVQRFSQILISLHQEEKINDATLINYFIILSAIDYAGVDSVSVYYPENDKDAEFNSMLENNNWGNYNANIPDHDNFYLRVRVTDDTLKSYNVFCYATKKNEHKSMEAEMIIQKLRDTSRFGQYRFLSVTGIKKFEEAEEKAESGFFILPSFSIVLSCLSYEGTTPHLPIVYFEKFSPETMLSGLRSHQRAVNLPPLYETVMPACGPVHGLKSNWFGVLLHDLYFHYPMESRSSDALKDLRVKVVDTVRGITKDAALLSSFLWRNCIDFEHNIEDFLVGIESFVQLNFDGIYFSDLYSTSVFYTGIQSSFEFCIALLLIAKENETTMTSGFNNSLIGRWHIPRNDFFRDFISVALKAAKLQFPNLSADESLAIRATYLFLYLLGEEKRCSAPPENEKKLNGTEQAFFNAMSKLTIERQYDGQPLLSALSFKKNPVTRKLDITISTEITAVPEMISLKKVMSATFLSPPREPPNNSVRIIGSIRHLVIQI